MVIDYAFIWAGLIAVAVLMYVLLDGFDLGIGILFPFLRDHDERMLAMSSVAPVWDGNETWLVLGGGGLFAVFPLGYAIVMPALYPLIIAMLLGLIFRGVAFEFVHRTERMKFFWEVAFWGGSLVAAIAQGLALGTLVQGVIVSGRSYGGGNWDWLTPFSILTAVALVVGYAMLGATWLIMKSEGSLQAHCHRLALWLGIATLAGMTAVSAATPFLSNAYYQRWFAWPQILFTAQVPLLVAIASVVFFVSLRRKATYLPFLIALGLFALGLIGLGISLYPYVVPRAITIWDAAAPTASLSFMLVGAVVMVPVILAYTGYAYWVFRGKTGSEGYH